MKHNGIRFTSITLNVNPLRGKRMAGPRFEQHEAFQVTIGVECDALFKLTGSFIVRERFMIVTLLQAAIIVSTVSPGILTGNIRENWLKGL